MATGEEANFLENQLSTILSPTRFIWNVAQGSLKLRLVDSRKYWRKYRKSPSGDGLIDDESIIKKCVIKRAFTRTSVVHRSSVFRETLVTFLRYRVIIDGNLIIHKHILSFREMPCDDMCIKLSSY